MSELTIITYGNFILTSKTEIEDLDLGHPSFKFDNGVQFLARKKKLFQSEKWECIADSYMLWFDYLKKKGCLGLRLYYRNQNEDNLDFQFAGFSGGGGYNFIETVYNGYSDYWLLRQDVTQKERKDKRIWLKSFGCVGTKLESQPECELNLKKHIDDFSYTLNEIQDFAKRQRLGHWSKFFERANKSLKGIDKQKESENLSGIPSKLLPDDILSIYIASRNAHVFGGMGSWNDLSFRDNDKYELYRKLSEDLYSMIMKSNVLIANWTFNNVC